MVGNHLAQHRELSLTAIGLGLYIQSVPGGTRIGIKDLAGRFTEGEIRIASALRELEHAGYLSRTQEHLPGGRIITRTVSYNRPGHVPERGPRPESRQQPRSEPRPGSRSDPTPPRPVPRPAPVAPVPAEPAAEVRPEAEPVPEPEPEPEPPADNHAPPAPVAVAAAAPVPAPSDVSPARRQAATELLGRLRRFDHRLLLGERDFQRLAPGVEAWLERGASSDAVVTALTANLPASPRNPAGLIAHRLAAQLPPLLGPLYGGHAHVPPDPFQTCDKCERAFRSPIPGRCGDCGEAGTAEAA
ncbi:helix-turn-helix domain-containing protein [Streptomyces sp. NBC_01351]|uniref:helix-turn-helix domain-containing protein n=1 Tax=Streptomyces sp. NBC_01351 TaxID=2903833 RepID=UPI002E31AB64|nr:helix-turn-helix domain-containing protein [Streptomyces sp. NBC_01351]